MLFLDPFASRSHRAEAAAGERRDAAPQLALPFGDGLAVQSRDPRDLAEPAATELVGKDAGQ